MMMMIENCDDNDENSTTAFLKYGQLDFSKAIYNVCKRCGHMFKIYVIFPLNFGLNKIPRE